MAAGDGQDPAPGVGEAGTPGLLLAMFADTDVGLLVEDPRRRVEAMNDAFLTMFGIPGSPESMLGADCAAAARAVAVMFADPQDWVTSIDALVAGGRPEHGRVLALADGRFLERDYVPVPVDDGGRGHAWLYRDVTAREQAVRELERGRQELDRSNALLRSTNDLLQTVARVQSMLLTTGDESAVFDELLNAALALTASEFGIFGEVVVDDQTGGPALLAHAHSDIAWDEASSRIVDDAKVSGFRFADLDGLFGAVMSGREVVLSNDPAHDPRAGDVPPGHPIPRSFLGLPVLAGDDLLGLVALANRPGGYDEEIVAWLQPLLSTCASVLLHARSDRARRRSEEEARTARGRAERASAAKNVFLSRMSHELRTPLNAMLGFAQLLEMRAGGEVDREDAARIVAAGRHLLALLDDVMDIAAIEAGRVSLDVTRIEVGRFVAECVDVVAPSAAERDIHVQVSSTPPDLAARADPSRLRQLLLNLLDNAVKYGRHAGTVDVVALADGDRVRIEVVDDGIGIGRDDAERVFAPFERGDGAALGVPGSGLGLAVARSLARAMGGDVVLDLGRPGRTVLRTILPMAGPPVAPEPRPRAVSGSGATKGRVVYVEDNATNAVLVRSVLAHLLPGVSLTVAPTGRRALDILAADPPDLLLLDLHLPDMDGLEVLDRSGLSGLVPAYVITADATSETRRRVLTGGLDGILVKPVNPRDLAETVGAALDRRERQG